MPTLTVDLNDMDDVRTALTVLKALLPASAKAPQPARKAHPPHTLAQAMTWMKRKKIWPFLHQVAELEVAEYSLPELAGHVGMSTNKVCSLKAILAKPEQRLNLQFFELAPSADATGNSRYTMPPAIRQAILAA